MGKRAVRTLRCRVGASADARCQKAQKRRVETRRGTQECVRHVDT